jgi:hypothetical protein
MILSKNKAGSPGSARIREVHQAPPYLLSRRTSGLALRACAVTAKLATTTMFRT